MSAATSLLLLDGSALPSRPGGWVWRGPTTAPRALQLFRWPGGDVGISVSNVFNSIYRTEIHNITTGRHIYVDDAETRIGGAAEPMSGDVCFGCEWGNNKPLFLGPTGRVTYGAKMKNWGISAVSFGGVCSVSSNQSFAGSPAKFTEHPTLANGHTGKPTGVFGARTLVNHMIEHNGRIYATGIFGEFSTMRSDGHTWPGDALMLCSRGGVLFCVTGARNVSGEAGGRAAIQWLDESSGWKTIATLPARQGTAIMADEAGLLVSTYPEQAVYRLRLGEHWRSANIIHPKKIHSGPADTQHPTRSFGSSLIPGYVAYTDRTRTYVHAI